MHTNNISECSTLISLVHSWDFLSSYLFLNSIYGGSFNNRLDTTVFYHIINLQVICASDHNIKVLPSTIPYEPSIQSESTIKNRFLFKTNLIKINNYYYIIIIFVRLSCRNNIDTSMQQKAEISA